ncbi:MAG: ATP-dependent RecD-like DNA helicase [Verrucomicrobiota bacterium]
MPDQLKGTLERIVFSNEEKQYLVAEFSPDGEKGKVTITGVMPGVQCGESLKVTGEWVSHPRHGKQFRISHFESHLPATIHGIRKYLGSGLIPGIGKTYASKIVDYFGEDTLRVISVKSARLREVPGIGKERARKIKEGWEEHRAFRSVMIFLQTYGVSAAKCLRLVKRYGESTEKILRANPYRLADEIEGIGFRTADQIAVNLGLPSDGPDRISAALSYSLQEAADEGHTVLARGDLIARASTVLGLPGESVEPILVRLIAEEQLSSIESDTLIQRNDLAIAEKRLATALFELLWAKSSLPAIQIEKAVDWAAARSGFAFAPEQVEALKASLANRVAILTGGPGTGKTTILRSLVAILSAKNIRVGLASPTGRAAQRMSEATGLSAKTVHRMLEYDPATGGFVHHEKKRLPYEYVIVDEASMLDVRLAASLISAVAPGATLLLVGDADQLPSVGPGDVLRNLIESERFSVVRLSQVFRQEGASRIVDLAYQVLGGNPRFPYKSEEAPSKPRPPGDVQWILAEDPDDCVDKTLRLVDYLPKAIPGTDPVSDIQVIVPLHKGVVGVGNLNERLKERLLSRNVRGGNTPFALGDKVIQTRNNYDLGIYNGDLGLVTRTDLPDGEIEVNFSGLRTRIGRGQVNDLSLAYAITVHKSQGSEYPIVILPLMKQHYLLLRRNLVYTALTRGKKAVYFVGDPAAYSMAVRQLSDQTRLTDLVRKVREAG